LATVTGNMPLSGKLRFQKISPQERQRAIRREIRRWHVRHFCRYRWREIPLEILLFCCGLLTWFIPGFNLPAHGRLYAKIVRANGEIWDYGHVGVHLIVTAGKAFVVDAWQNLVELENMKFHGIGTGATAPAAGDTALQTELTTQYNPDNTRATGSLAEASATVFRTVGTNTVDAAAAVTEWGLLSQAATGGGTLFDRQTFSVVNLANGDSFQTTYDLTVS